MRLEEAAAILRKERRLKTMVAKAERAIGKAFTRQGADFTKRLAKERAAFKAQEAKLREEVATTPDWEPLFTATEVATLALLAEPITALAQAALEAGVRVAIADLAIELDWSLENPRAVAFLKDRGAARVALINGTTRSELKTLLTQAMDRGWSYDKTAKAIREQFEGFAGRRPQKHIQSRAHLVAVTEAGEAYEHGNLSVGQELQAAGLEMQKSWLTVGDSRVSALCSGNQAAGWIALDDAFPSGHDRPLGHPACRCTALYQRKRTAK